jgi:hypothetical protein
MKTKYTVCKGCTSGDNIARFAIICQLDEICDRDRGHKPTPSFDQPQGMVNGRGSIC